MVNPNDATEVVPYLTSAAVIVYIMKYLKTREFYKDIVSKIPMADKYIHRIVAGVSSLIAAVGIHITFKGDYNSGWTFAGSIPNMWDMLHAIADWIKVFALQQWAYDSTKQPSMQSIAHETAITAEAKK